MRLVALALVILLASPVLAQDGGAPDAAAGARGVERDGGAPDAGAPDAGAPDGDGGAVPDAGPEPIPVDRLPRVEVALDRDEVELGQVVRLRLSVSYQPGDRVHLRDRSLLGPLEILGSSRQVGHGDQEPSEVIELELIGFEVGDLEVPGVELMVVLSDGRTGTVSTDPQRLTITDPLANEPDPQPRGDHDPRPVYTTDRRALWAVGIITSLLLAVLLGLALERWRSRRKPRPAPPPPPPRPPEEVALEKLREAERSGLLEAGEIKAFHIAISEALREYLGGRYGFDSLEMTTKELVLQLDQATLRGITRTELQEFLRETDLVKFAKWRPDVERSKDLLGQAFDIVNRTTAAERTWAVAAAPAPTQPPGPAASAGGADGA
jgi:hypothetical protein